MRVLHAYNQHRGGGGADNATRATIELSRNHGLKYLPAAATTFRATCWGE
jgi:hypothetical protein